MQDLSQDETQRMERALLDALKECRHVILLTHVPPFAELSLGPGRKVHSDWTPFFCAQAMGERLVEIMQAHPNHRLQVLCGHTHTAATDSVLPNLTVRVGGAHYGAPAVSGVLKSPEFEVQVE